MPEQNSDVKKERQSPKRAAGADAPLPKPRQKTAFAPAAPQPKPAVQKNREEAPKEKAGEKPPAKKPVAETPPQKPQAPVVDAEKTAPAPALPQENPPGKTTEKLPTLQEKPPEKRKPKPDSEQVRLKKEEQARRVRRRNRQIIGLAVSILVVVGAVSIIMGGINMARNIFDDSGEIKDYQNRFKAFVWFDILPFDSIAQMDEHSLKQVVIWSIFDDQSESLSRNENGEAQVPASEVERYGAALFGPDFRFSGHESFKDNVFDLPYSYDAETLMYSVPSTGLNPNYLPTVMQVVREPGGVRRVVVGYVSTRTSDNQVVQTPDYEHPARYMDYMLRRDGNSYYLFAVRKNETYVPNTAPSQSTAPSSGPIANSLPALEVSSLLNYSQPLPEQSQSQAQSISA